MYYAAPPAAVMQWWQHLPIPAAILNPFHPFKTALRNIIFISKMYLSLWKPPAVSGRIWSVNLDASMSGECQNIGEHSGQPSENLGSLMTGTDVPWKLSR
jgi:hypothetical protein